LEKKYKVCVYADFAVFGMNGTPDAVTGTVEWILRFDDVGEIYFMFAE